MEFEEIEIVGEPVARATDAEVDELESALGCRLPSEYREYVTRLGEGRLAGGYIRVYPPWRILRGANHHEEWRARVSEHWFWDDGREVLTKERGLECVLVADTAFGDELVFHPSAPDDLFALPAEEETIYRLGPGLLAAVGWVCTSGKLIEPITERDFVAFDSRKPPASGRGRRGPRGRR